MDRTTAQRDLGELRIDVELAGLNKEETCEGPGFSPQVSIGGLRSNFIALVMEDAGPPNDVYWILWNVPRTDTIPRNLPKEGELDGPICGRQGRNTRGGYGYAAPCPAPGEEGRYVLHAYGVENMLDLDASTTTKDDLVSAMEGLVREQGEKRMTYSRKRQWSSSSEY